MTLLDLIQTVPLENAKLIDEILEFSSYAAQKLELGNGKGTQNDPEGWDRNKLLKLTISALEANLIWLKNNNVRKASYYIDFSGELKVN